MGCGRQDKEVSATVLLPTGWQARRPNSHKPQHYVINSRAYEQYGGHNSPIMHSGLLRQFSFFVITKIFCIIRSSWNGVLISLLLKRAGFPTDCKELFHLQRKKTQKRLLIEQAGDRWEH